MRRMHDEKDVISKVKIDENNVLVVEDAAGNKQEFEIQASEVSPEVLAEVLEGSDTVVVDINEAGTKVQVSLDQDVVDEIDSKSTVSASQTGTSTNEINYLTVDNVEYKLPSGGGGQAQFEQVILNMTDCIDQQRSTQDRVVFKFNFNINTLFPVQIVSIYNNTDEYYLRGALSFLGGTVLKFNNDNYKTGVEVEEIDPIIIGTFGYAYNEIGFNRDELEDFSGYSEERTSDEYYFILYKNVGSTKSGGWEV